MRKAKFSILHTLLLCSLLILPSARAGGQGVLADLVACKDLGFSTEEDFVTRGPLPPDGSPLISDGDLLGPAHAVCARNAELLAVWKETVDLGLDAVDIISVEPGLVAFSTELDDPAHRFTAGDLLATNGTAIPNTVLLTQFQINHDMGLDGLQLTGSAPGIVGFLDRTAPISRAQWLANPALLFNLLNEFKVDIWLSTESTQLQASAVPILDGDLLSVGTGTILVHQADLLPAAVPAGLPARGVDFGLDAIAASRNGDIRTLRFSTEILFRGVPAFTDGDVLKKGNGIELLNGELVGPFEPYARFLGLDALSVSLPPTAIRLGYLPLIMKFAH
jgi:hypothetical protein